MAERYREQVEVRSGLRLFTDDEAVAADGYPEFTEVFLDKAMSKLLSSEAEARSMAANVPGALVTRPRRAGSSRCRQGRRCGSRSAGRWPARPVGSSRWDRTPSGTAWTPGSPGPWTHSQPGTW